MYKKAMSCLLMVYLLFLFGFLCISGIEQNRDTAVLTWEIRPDQTVFAEKKISCLGIMKTAASGQRIVDYNVLTRVSRYTFSNEELEVLKRIVEAEAGGEDEEGKLLVANVVINRVKSEEFPDTISEVVFQRGNGVTQFSPIATGRYYSVEISDETCAAVERALEGEDISKGALYFVARKYAEDDRIQWFDENLTFLFEYGGHEFFR